MISQLIGETLNASLIMNHYTESRPEIKEENEIILSMMSSSTIYFLTNLISKMTTISSFFQMINVDYYVSVTKCDRRTNSCGTTRGVISLKPKPKSDEMKY